MLREGIAGAVTITTVLLIMVVSARLLSPFLSFAGATRGLVTLIDNLGLSPNLTCLPMMAIPRVHGDDPARRPVFMVHGATYASRLHDLPHPGASWVRAVADSGLAGSALVIQGYGRSRSEAMTRSTAPYARARDATRDIDDALRWIRARHATEPRHLIGGSWGAIKTALDTATIGRPRVARLVLCAPILAERNAGWLELLADPARPERFNPAFGAARLVTEEATGDRWDAEIPHRADWRDEAVFQALVRSSLADDPASGVHHPPDFRAPNRSFLDLWQALNGRPLYDPAAILCPTLLIRGGAGSTSRRSDALRLFDRLGAADRHYVEIANGAHFVRGERRAPQVFDAVNAFLNNAGF
jgi:alpha-beta hydrolase superfamily lysophospholipase